MKHKKSILCQKMREELKYYVYALYVKGSNNPFYIGKGNGDRIYSHLNQSLKLTQKEVEDNLKLNIIKKNKIYHKVLRHGLTEKEAFEVEATLIDYLGLDYLSNKVRGKGSYRGLMTLDEIITLYNATEIKKIPEKAILININKQYRKVKNNSQKLFAATIGNWVLGDKKNSAEYAFSVSYGIVRQIIKIDPSSWEKVQTIIITNKNGKISRKNRWSFNGKVIKNNKLTKKYINSSVRSFWKTGSQNPIRYSYK